MKTSTNRDYSSKFKWPRLTVSKLVGKSKLFWGGMELTQVLMIQQHSHGQSRKLLGIQQAIFTSMATIGAMIGGGLIELDLSIDDLFRISTLGRLVVVAGLIYNLRFFGPSRLSFSVGRSFLYSVLSLRPSPVNTGRIIPVDADENTHET